MDNASPLPRLAAPLAPAGSIRLPSPALGLFRMPEGYVLLSRDGAFFSTVRPRMEATFCITSSPPTGQY